jgi:alpha-tubulin suppressor-like RCC1 family protein
LPVPTEVTGGIVFTQLSVGAHTVCGVADTEDAYCWGSGFRGERGDDTFVLQQATPVRVVAP